MGLTSARLDVSLRLDRLAGDRHAGWTFDQRRCHAGDPSGLPTIILSRAVRYTIVVTDGFGIFHEWTGLQIVSTNAGRSPGHGRMTVTPARDEIIIPTSPATRDAAEVTAFASARLYACGASSAKLGLS
jgi:hypothetical protein